MKEKIPMSRYDLRHTLASVIASAAILSFTGCGGGSEAEISVNKTPVVTENNATPVVSPSNTGNETETKVAVKIPAEILKSGPMVADASGNLYIADRTKCSIVKVTPSGEASLFAGRSRKCPDASIQPKDGIGDQAEFGYLKDISIDTAGNIYVTDNMPIDSNGIREINGASIRKITPNGMVTRLAGSFSETGYVDASQGDARFDGIYGLTTDNEGNVYVADRLNQAIRKITKNGNVSTFLDLSSLHVGVLSVLCDDTGGLYILATNGLGHIVSYKDKSKDDIEDLYFFPDKVNVIDGWKIDMKSGDIYFLWVDAVNSGQAIFRFSKANEKTFSAKNMINFYASIAVLSPGILAVLDNGKITRFVF